MELLTPSIGLALGVQRTHRENGATAFDAATPSLWAQVAPGATFSVAMFELPGRLRVPLDTTNASSPTVDLALGFYF